MALIEGFESFSGGLPNTIPWQDDSFGATITQTTSHVTQGTYSCRFQLSDGSSDFFAISTGGGSFNTDLTGASFIYLDVYIADIPSDAQVRLIVIDINENFAQDTTTIGGTGVFELAVDLTSITTKDRTAIIIRSDATGGEATALDVYVDNLRDDIAGGAITVMGVTGPAEVIGVSSYAKVIGVEP